MMKTINFKAPCHIGDVIYYAQKKKKDNKYTFRMKKRVVCGFLIEDFRRYVCVKDRSGIDGTVDVSMNCVSKNKDVIKAAYKILIDKNSLKKKGTNIFSTGVYDVFSETISVRSEYELGDRFINRYKVQDTVTGILVRNESEIASIMGENGGVYHFLELE